MPVVTDIMLLAKQAGETEQTGPETWVFKRRHYSLSFCKATDTISLVAQDSRGELLRLQGHNGAWRTQLAQGLTVKDVGQIQTAHRQLNQATQAPSALVRSRWNAKARLVTQLVLGLFSDFSGSP